MGSTSDNFKGEAPNISTQDFSGGMQNSMNGFNSSLAQQQELANLLGLQTQGYGPNPSLSQLQGATNQNNQQAAGLLASQRGLNPALAARLASQTSAANNQTAANQASTLRANQQLANQEQLGNLLSNIGNQNLNLQTILQQSQSNQNNAINTGSLGAQGLTGQAQAQTSASNGQVIGGIANGVGSIGGAVLGGALKGPAGPANVMTTTYGAAPPLPNYSSGGKIPGRANVPGDSPKNDIVPIEASPGEIVIPRSASTDPDKAKEFIDHLMSEKPDEPKGYAKVLASHRKLQERMAELEKKVKGKKA